MRNIILTIFIIFIVGLPGLGLTQQNDANLWEKEFVMALQKGKTTQPNSGNALGYTPPPGVVLESAIKKAMEMQAPPCEAMKIAVDLKYDAYSILTNIFGHGSQVNLNQLCGCATESGINKQIVAQAASKAVSPIGTPVFKRDEIAQAQCLTGLGYTPYAAQITRVKRQKKIPISPLSPGSSTGETEEIEEIEIVETTPEFQDES